MKFLATLFRFLCALVVLLALAVYLDGALQTSVIDYLAAFTPEHLMSFADIESWVTIAAAGLLLLTLCCGLRLGWNIVYSLATLVFFAEVALLVLGPEWALPSATRGLGWEPVLRELALNYPVPTLLIPALCILGCLCSNAPVRIAWTSLLCCALIYGCAELLHYGVAHWKAMPEPFMPNALAAIEQFPWILAALPAVFFVQYSLFMAMFESFIPRKRKALKAKKTNEADAKLEDKPAETKNTETKTAEAKPVAKAAAGTPVVVIKRPIVHKKSPISPAPAEEKKEETTPEAPAPAEEKKEEPTPEAPAPAEEKKEDAPAEAPAPVEEKKENAPAVIPSVPLPPAASK